jgi:hypothetical protein
MPRNASGTFSLVAGNPVITGTVIASDWANTTMPDLGAEMTDSLSRTAKGGMLASLRGIDGVANGPSFTFTNFPNSGLYAKTAADIRMSIQGVDRMRWVAGIPEVLVGGIWYPVLLSGNTALEAQTLIGGQTIVTFVNNQTGASFIVSGHDADNGEIFDYTYNDLDQILTLPESYPAGTKIYAKKGA